MPMENEQIRQTIMRELPGILERDPEIRAFILRLSRRHFADKAETESRFDRLLEELRRDRERSERRWEEHLRESRAFREEQNRKWEEQNRKWEEQNRKWEAQNRKWEENTARLDRTLDAIEAQVRKHDQHIGALGARWGVQTEQAFRSALAGILKDISGIEVAHVTEYDDRGEVFGHPDQIELDLILKDGQLIIGEIKSSMSKGEMYLFERKARFYEKTHRRCADRLVVISPMVARRAAEQLGIEVYSYAEDAGEALGTQAS